MPKFIKHLPVHIHGASTRIHMHSEQMMRDAQPRDKSMLLIRQQEQEVLSERLSCHFLSWKRGQPNPTQVCQPQHGHKGLPIVLPQHSGLQLYNLSNKSGKVNQGIPLPTLTEAHQAIHCRSQCKPRGFPVRYSYHQFSTHLGHISQIHLSVNYLL